MHREKNYGDSNREADRHYRRRVRLTVEHATDEEGAADARALTGEERQEARAAERHARAKARSAWNKRDI